jgi:hypothetical protein
MNTKQLIALVAFALAGTTAMADTITIDNSVFVPTRTRAEVKAEVQAARADGSMPQFVTEAEAQRPAQKAAVASTLTREQVRAEVRSAPRTKLDVYNIVT